MKHLPIEYRLFLVALITFLFLTGAYAIADGAVLDPQAGLQSGSAPDSDGESLTWYEDTAVWICPLH